ncbi:STAS domain-containing protein [Mycolicibacterium litorale]|uniref:STAS domain-containing protein n=1 Tax=Mycolicibacterium litorale TaxID=758802 RepID=UPI0039A12650
MTSSHRQRPSRLPRGRRLGPTRAVRSSAHTAGGLLSDAAEQLMLRLTDELNQTPLQVVIDVAAVTVIDAPGAKALVLAAAMAGAIDVPLYLCG